MNLFELFVKIGVDDQASGKLSDLSSKLGNGLKTAAKIGTAAVGTAAAGITALTKSAVDNYAEYEQLVGGVDTLFKDASQKVQQYAADAYKTSGMSANDYMANATAFSASLISSLGGDTEKAAEYANRAMVSMSDNANKMGSNIDSIVQTYQSLARGNFAMLDNLKLGYGGTKAELERLIKDAASYTDIQKKMGITVDASSMSFDNIVNAIAVVQGKLGIAGATAEEAGTTIEGSVNSMKAAWANLVTGIADENADMEGLIGNFVDSIVTVGGNLLPRIEQIFLGIGTLIEKLAPVIGEALPQLISTVLPSLLNAGFSLLTGLVDGIMDNLDALIEAAFQVIDMLLDGIIDNLPRIVTMGIELIGKLAVGLIRAIPSLVSKVPELIGALAHGFVDFSGKVVEIGINLVKRLWDGIKQMWKNVVSWAGNAISNLFGGKNKVDVAVNGKVNGSHANGLDYVPFNGYIAELHRGEMVLTAAEARKLRNGTNEERPIIINLTTTLDGKVIGETSYRYAQNMARAMGV